MLSHLPHGGDVLGAAPANPILAPVLSQDRGLGMSRQRDLLDLQAIQRIPGLVGYWKADPQYLFEDSAGTTPASTSGTGPVGQWRAVNSTRSVGSEMAGTIPTPTIANNAGTVGVWDAGTKTMTNTGSAATGYPRFLFNLGIVVGSTYLVTGALTGAISKCTGIRLAQTGTANSVPYDSATGIFSGEVTASYAHFEIDTNLVAGESLVISSISVKPVTGNHAIQWTTANKPILRKTPTTGVYWADSNTSTSALNVALSDAVLERRNLCTYTETFTGRTSGITVSSTGLADPYGGTSAALLLEDATTEPHYVYIASIAAATYNVSITIKKYNRRYVMCAFGTNLALSVDLDTGIVSSQVGTPQNIICTPIGSDGWYVLTFVGVSNTSQTVNVYSSIDGVYVNRFYAGDTGQGFYLCHPQVELGSVATNYQKITNVPAYCTLARATAEGVTFTDNAEISPTYNIAPAFSFNADVAIFNRTLTTTEKALVTRYMQRAVPMLGSNLITNGTFDTNTTGWSARTFYGVGATSVTDGVVSVSGNGVDIYGALAQVPITVGSVGTQFVVKARIRSVSGSNSVIRCTNASHTNQSPSLVNATTTFANIEYAYSQAATSGTGILIGANSVSGTAEFDDISMRQIL